MLDVKFSAGQQNWVPKHSPQTWFHMKRAGMVVNNRPAMLDNRQQYYPQRQVINMFISITIVETCFFRHLILILIESSSFSVFSQVCNHSI